MIPNTELDINLDH